MKSRPAWTAGNQAWWNPDLSHKSCITCSTSGQDELNPATWLATGALIISLLQLLWQKSCTRATWNWGDARARGRERKPPLTALPHPLSCFLYHTKWKACSQVTTREEAELTNLMHQVTSYFRSFCKAPCDKFCTNLNTLKHREI